MKQIKHFYQIMHSRCFQQYDYGSEENLKIYNSTKPPSYNLCKITVPTFVYYGTNDNYMKSREIEKFISTMPNIQELNELACNHLEFLLSDDLKELVNGKVVDSLNANNNVTEKGHESDCHKD